MPATSSLPRLVIEPVPASRLYLAVTSIWGSIRFRANRRDASDWLRSTRVARISGRCWRALSKSVSIRSAASASGSGNSGSRSRGATRGWPSMPR